MGVDGGDGGRGQDRQAVMPRQHIGACIRGQMVEKENRQIEFELGEHFDYAPQQVVHVLCQSYAGVQIP